MVDEKAQVRHVGLLREKGLAAGNILGKNYSGEEFYRQARQESGHTWYRGIVELAGGESALVLDFT